jgi:hypothetical protein
MHKLQAYTAHDEPLQVQAEIAFTEGLLRVRFEVSDPENRIQDTFKPAQHANLKRADNLWKTTCLEAFWSEPGKESYWELNISPAGQGWNVYKFENYRKPHPPPASRDFELKDLRITGTSLEAVLQSHIKLQAPEASLCAVIRTKSGTHYYASAHAAEKPDFHFRKSFQIK